jgi:hypothetical protein
MKVVFVNKDRIAAEELSKKLLEKWTRRDQERAQKKLMQKKSKIK